MFYYRAVIAIFHVKSKELGLPANTMPVSHVEVDPVPVSPWNDGTSSDILTAEPPGTLSQTTQLSYS